jgi:hypothetical protein
MMRLGLAEAVGRPNLIAQREQEIVSLAGTPLPSDPLAILLDPSLRHTAEAIIAKACAIDPATLRPGDILVTGTPAGVGFARKPSLFTKHGDVCEIEIEGGGLLRNPIVDERAA